MSAADAAALLRRQPRHALRLRQPRLPALAADAGRRRASARYSRDDVERLRRRTEERRNPDKAAARALQWGMPVLESSITLIDGQRLYYRGHDALTLARTRSVEEVASLVWTGRFDTRVRRPRRRDGRQRHAGVHARLPFVARAQSRARRAAARDPLAFDLRPERGAHRGWRILQLLTAAASGGRHRRHADDRSARSRGRGASSARGADVLRAALILCADHELNVSSFTARCVASAGSHPYAVVIAGLAALEGRSTAAPARASRRCWRRCAGRRDLRRRHGRTAAARRTDRRLRPPAVPRRRSRARRCCSTCCASDTRSRRSSRFVLDVRGGGDRGHRETPERRLRARRRRARAAAAAGLAADAVRNRPDDRLDRSRDRAVRDRAADSAAREVRRRTSLREVLVPRLRFPGARPDLEATAGHRFPLHRVHRSYATRCGSAA